MNLQDMMDKDAAHAHTTLGHVVNFGGTLTPCVVSDLRTGGETEFEYMAATADVEIRLRVAATNWTPAKGKQLSFNSEKLEVESFIKTTNQLEWVLFCTADHRR